MRRCVFIVAKDPASGLAKTRLAAGIGAERAVALYRCFLQDTVATVRCLTDCTLAFSFWPPTAASSFQALAPEALLLPQCGETFGERLLSGFTQAAAHGFEAIVLLGSDNPGVPSGHIAQAFAALDAAPCVIGPSEDGGYYLLGMGAPQPTLFANIAWSTEVVAQQTYAAARVAGLHMASAPGWYDIDTAADLPRLYQDLQAGHGGADAPRTLAQLALFARDGLCELLAPRHRHYNG